MPPERNLEHIFWKSSIFHPTWYLSLWNKKKYWHTHISISPSPCGASDFLWSLLYFCFTGDRSDIFVSPEKDDGGYCEGAPDPLSVRGFLSSELQIAGTAFCHKHGHSNLSTHAHCNKHERWGKKCEQQCIWMKTGHTPEVIWWYALLQECTTQSHVENNTNIYMCSPSTYRLMLFCNVFCM